MAVKSFIVQAPSQAKNAIIFMPYILRAFFSFIFVKRRLKTYNLKRNFNLAI